MLLDLLLVLFIILDILLSCKPAHYSKSRLPSTGKYGILYACYYSEGSAPCSQVTKLRFLWRISRVKEGITSMTDSNLEATGLSHGKGGAEDLDVEALIQQTLEESKALKKAATPPAEKKEEKAYAATGISISKKESAAPINPSTPFSAEPTILAAATQPSAAAPATAPAPTKSPEQTTAKELQGTAVPAQDAFSSALKEYKAGDLVVGTIAKVDNNSVLVDIGYKAEGFLDIKEFAPEEIKAGIKVGDKINVLIERLENREGYVVLSKRKADYENSWNQAYRAYKDRSLLEAKVTSAVKGGLVVDYNGIRGFIPASQVKKEAEGKLEDFVGTVIPIKVIQIDRRTGKVVLSHKLAAEEKKQYEKEKLFNEIEVGQVKHGAVSSIKSFGAFVNLSGIEGLIHVSELSWKRVKHPSEVLKVGQELDVFVLGVDKINHKIALGLKELQADPWAEAANHFKVGQVAKGKVARLATFGAFIELDHNLEGLCHVSELSLQPVKEPSEAVKPGDEVEVKILRILPDEQKIGLSIRRVLQDREKARLKEEQDKLQAQKEAESRVTIGDMLKQKETEKQEREEKAAAPEAESMAAQSDLEISEKPITPPEN
jgi:ribosomal protein S1